MESGVPISGGSPTKFCYDYVIPTALSTVCHPFVVARTLMMLGHEYEPPTLGRNLLGLQRYMYPNVFNYLGHLREDVGLASVFTVGLPASVIGSAIKVAVCEKYLRVSFIYAPLGFLEIGLFGFTISLTIIFGDIQYEHVTGYIYKKSIIETEQGFEVFVQETCKLTAGRCLGLIVSYPLQVIMIRQIAELIGNENIYSNIVKAFVEININEGLPGLLRGLIPRLLGEVITVWLTAGLAYIVNRWLLPEGTDPTFKSQTPYVASLLVSSCTHRLTVTSTVMAVSGSRLSLEVPFKNSLDCYNYLSRRNAFIRGASLFFRYASGPL